MKNNNTNHQKVGGLVRCVSLISLLAMSSSAFAKNIEYQITLGSPAVVDTNAEHVTFHINFAEPVSGLTLQRFQLFNDAMSSTLASLVQAPNSSTLYHLKVNTAGTGARISAYARNSGDANSPVTPVTDASGEVVTLTLPVNVPLATYIIDKTPPGAPTIAEPIYSLTQDPVIKGVAESGTRLTVVSAPGNQTCTVDVDGDGNWECNLVPVLPVGLATLSATTVDKAGNRSDPGQRNLHVLSSGGDEDNDGITNQNEISLLGTKRNIIINITWLLP